MQVIPLAPVPSQTVAVFLGGQSCNVNIYQKRYGMFLDLYVGGNLLIGGVVCQNLNRIVRSAYLGFTGDLCFYDTQGSDDPDYTVLGSRFVLLYLAPGETGVAT